MYVIIGGAYNGKRSYVDRLITTMENKETIYCDGSLPEIIQASTNKRYVISRFEEIVKPYLHLKEEEVASQIAGHILTISKQTEIICICTDMSRGVVPLEKEARQLRDTCGRVYQQLCQNANTVIRVWYGIPQYLKGEQ
ncbi:MAG: bifunctional adenosylcobinamide kinase/adenosylcobinamide-phosphate guanylyltransferase [Solibacillus sp.]|jgi:adenosylcobinamide kinase / adenosylcobinamide-phosphate guanylyltransferase|uniref:bifunctional adenosylcobinamide kinase/adenosylcobinamide-phosphate guanylyltransferase n=1 Tax=unclassified Solibacillus TaxID=2637870 RepID=UPI0030F8B27F